MTGPSLAELFDWWTGDLSEEESERVETALFENDEALAAAEWLLELAKSVAVATTSGGIVATGLPHAIVERLLDAGIPHRAYVVEPGGFVPCAATADQRFALVRLKGDFADVERVDVRLTSPHLGEIRVDDVTINWQDSEIALLQAGDAVRATPTTTLTFDLLGHRAGVEIALGTYVLRHTAMDDVRGS